LTFVSSLKIHVRPYLWFGLSSMLLLTGCSTFKIWYAFADDMIESRAEDYLDLDAAQQAELEKQSVALVAWHRKVMLPKYAVFFMAQADMAEAGGWDRSQMSDAFDDFRILLNETVKGASPFVARVLSDHMTDEKLAYLEARTSEFVAERRAEIEQDSPEDILDERVERREKGISRFTGSLDNKQVAIIRQHLQNRVGGPLRWLENREMRHAALVKFLRTQPDQRKIAHFVHQIVLHVHEITDPDYRTYSVSYWATLENVYFDVMASLSDEQRQELVSTLRGYASDMIELSVGA
jgi:hypothetical protein